MLRSGIAGLLVVIAIWLSLAWFFHQETAGGWRKSAGNPVLGGKLGTCFDVSVLKEENTFRMWFSWRPRGSIALTESADGMSWSEPIEVLTPAEASPWEQRVNRPVVLKRPDGYHMWYTGQSTTNSHIGHAISRDGLLWQRTGERPVLSPEVAWEKAAVMCPHVIWDEEVKRYRMWYSGGEQYEPDAIGYAESLDGRTWEKHPGNPVFRPDPAVPWEQAKVAACHVLQRSGWHIMFYIGFRDIHHAAIGLARSRDGLSGWQRHPDNPIIRPGWLLSWDRSAVYKPSVLLEPGRWLLYYNGRAGGFEQIGLALREGEDLDF
jgi:predicted GH43/DUF377 family glycosyl hydrolase